MVALFALNLILGTIIVFPQPMNFRSHSKETLALSKAVGRLEKLDRAKLKKLIQNRNGKALFINVWATWCEPCVVEFPDIVKLSGEMKGQNIEFVGVSGDDFDDEKSKVLPFIAREKGEFKFYIAKLEGDDAFIDTFDKQWGGGMPATFTYDAKGELKAFLVGKQSYLKLRGAIEKALAR